MPPHSGHRYLIDVARGVADRLTIVLCSLAWEPIPGELRYAWLREWCDEKVQVVHITEEIPAARRDQAGATAIWADAVRRYVADPVDAVFASETYGAELAAHLGARFIALDPARASIPVSASAIRNDPYSHWRFLSAPVRAYYALHLAVLAPAATVVELAQRAETVAAIVPEQSPADPVLHRATIAALARASNRAVFHAIDSLRAAELCAEALPAASRSAPAAFLTIDDLSNAPTAMWVEPLRYLTGRFPAVPIKKLVYPRSPSRSTQASENPLEHLLHELARNRGIIDIGGNARVE